MPTLELTTVAACAVRCTYCPQDALKASYRRDSAHRLTLEALCIVLDKLPPYVRIDFSGFVEPWLNPECTEMLAATLSRGRSVGIYTTLQGMTDPEVVAELLGRHRRQVEVLCLHLPDAHGNMTGHRDDAVWRHALGIFSDLRERGSLSRFETMTMSETGETAPLVSVKRLLPWTGSDRAGALNREAVQDRGVERPVRHKAAVACSFTPFYDQNVMLPNGDVVLCCMDYTLNEKLGNLFEQEYHELFEGEAMALLRAANMRPDSRSICKLCTRATRYVAPAGARQMWQEDKP